MYVEKVGSHPAGHLRFRKKRLALDQIKPVEETSEPKAHDEQCTVTVLRAPEEEDDDITIPIAPRTPQDPNTLAAEPRKAPIDGQTPNNVHLS